MLLGTTANGSALTEANGFKYFFIPAPTYSGLGEIALQQIKKMAGSAKPRIAFVHSNIEFGRDPAPYIIERIKSLGFELALEEENRDDRC